MKWVDEITFAMQALGGAARYSDLYEFIELTTDRALTKEWKASVRRTIEDHSSDSANFRGEDLFEHVSHGHWKLRGADIEDNELNARENLTPQEVMARVFVREHWRRMPKRDYERKGQPIFAWCDHTMLRMRLYDGREIGAPISWYAFLTDASHAVRNDLRVTATGVAWDSFGEEVSFKSILEGVAHQERTQE